MLTEGLFSLCIHVHVIYFDERSKSQNYGKCQRKLHPTERINYCLRGVRGRVVTVADFKSLAPHRCGFEPRSGQ